MTSMTSSTRRAVFVVVAVVLPSYSRVVYSAFREDEYAKGGLTTQANGRAYCKPHNLQRNRQRSDDEDGRAPPD